MSVEIFSKEQFEAALPVDRDGNQLWFWAGLDRGEHSYIIEVQRDVRITVRSSVGPDGMSAASGQDSIRAWLCDITDRPLSPKTQNYITRVPGWQDRLTRMLRELWKRGKAVGRCQAGCRCLMPIYRVKKDGPNKGRLFTKCPTCNGGFKWLD